MYRFGIFSLFAATLLFLSMTACDFDAVSDAVNDFDVIVELQPLATVVSVQALDATTTNPIGGDVTVAFEGPDASSAIDVFSDPISSLQFKGGFSTFGLDAGLNPSADTPAELLLRVRSEGFVPTSVPLRVTREGTITRPIRLVPDNPNQSPKGTAGQRRRSNVQDDGSTEGEVTVETGSTSADDNAAQASARMPAGTTLRTADGTPLQGRITTDLSVYDNSADAQSLLPEETRISEDGVRRLIQGALRFQVQDDNGNVAAQFDNAGSDTTSIDVQLPSLNTQDGTPVLVFVNPETGETTTILAKSSTARSRAQTASMSTSLPFAKNTGTWHFSVSDNSVSVTSPSGITFGPVELDQVGNLFATIGVDPSGACTPSGALTIDPNGQEGSITLSFSSDGFSGEKTFASKDLDFISGAEFGSTLPDIGSVDILITTSDGQTVETTIDWCSDKKSVTLPAPTGDRIDATIRVEPDCPAGQRVPLTGNVDGYTLNYRLAGSENSYQTVDKEDIAISYTEDAKGTFDHAVVSVYDVLPSTDYEFYSAFGEEGNGGQRIIAMPASDGDEVVFTDDELTDLCE